MKKAKSNEIAVIEVQVVLVIRVADETSDDDIALLDEKVDELENGLDDPTELIYEAARDQMEDAAAQIARKLTGDYDIRRQVMVKRRSEK